MHGRLRSLPHEPEPLGRATGTWNDRGRFGKLKPFRCRHQRRSGLGKATEFGVQPFLAFTVAESLQGFVKMPRPGDSEGGRGECLAKVKDGFGRMAATQQGNS